MGTEGASSDLNAGDVVEVEISSIGTLSSVKVIEKYGAQIDGRLTLTGEMTFRFRNGVYVNTHDEKVYRYGIVTVP
jgi:hypothetical protein